MNTQQIELLLGEHSPEFLKRLFNPAVGKALRSQPVVEFLIAYGKASQACLPLVRAAGEKAYDEKIDQGFSVDGAEQAAFTARLNELLKVPFPPFPGYEALSSGTSAVPDTPPSLKDSALVLPDAEEPMQ